MPDKFQNTYRIPSARLPGYDYGQNGSYFITICTRNKEPYFGEIVEIKNGNIEGQNENKETQNGNSDGQNGNKETQNIASLQPSLLGFIADEFWKRIPEHFSFIILDEHIVMPDHLHGILHICKSVHDIVETQYFASHEIEPDFKNKFGPQSQNISSVIRGYKAGVKSVATTNEIDFQWQSRFHDHIIRSNEELKRIRSYIMDNPANWLYDKKNTRGFM